MHVLVWFHSLAFYTVYVLEEHDVSRCAAGSSGKFIVSGLTGNLDTERGSGQGEKLNLFLYSILYML